MPPLSSTAKLYNLGKLPTNESETWLFAFAWLMFFEGTGFWFTLSLSGL